MLDLVMCTFEASVRAPVHTRSGMTFSSILKHVQVISSDSRQVRKLLTDRRTDKPTDRPGAGNESLIMTKNTFQLLGFQFGGSYWHFFGTK